MTPRGARFWHICALLLAGVLGARAAGAVQWASYAVVSPTAPMAAGHICYSDGYGIACDAAGPTMGGLVTGYSDRIISNTTSVFAAYDGPVSVTIAGSNVANFGSGGLGITAINASGLITSAGVSSSAGISGTTGYFTDKLTVAGSVGNVNIKNTGNEIEFTRNGVNNINVSNASGQLAFYSGGSANAAMFIDSTRNIGVNMGVNRPVATLQVSGTFIVSNSSQATTPSLYVGSAGQVGIGISSPALQSGGSGLHIHDSTNSEIKFTNSTTGSATTDGTALVTTGANFTINNRENGNFTLGTNNTTRMHISAAGLVGISTTTPQTTLDVSGSLKISNGGEGCSASTAGGIRYTGGNFEFCSGSAWQTLGVLAGASSDRITSGTSTVFVAQDGPVSFTIAGSNVANFGSGGLGITAINASGLIQSTGISNTGAISTTGTGYFGGNVLIGANITLQNNGAGYFSTIQASSFSTSANNVGMTFINRTFSNSSGVQLPIQVVPTINQSGSAGFSVLRISPYLQAQGTGAPFLLDVGSNSAAAGAGTHTSLFVVNSVGRVGIGIVTPTTALEVSGTVSATNIQTSGTVYAGSFVGDGSGLTGIGSGDRITSGTSSVFVAQSDAVSVTIAGSNVANFGSGGLGITAINASGLVTAAGISTTGVISTTGLIVQNDAINAYMYIRYGGTNSGLYRNGNNLVAVSAGTDVVNLSQMTVASTGGYRWSSNSSLYAYDTGLVRTGAAKVAVGNGAAGDYTGTLIASTIGVGTPSPTATLQVSGSFIVSNTNMQPNPALYVSGTTGYVGIGTASPRAVLEISGTSSVFNLFRIYGSSASEFLALGQSAQTSVITAGSTSTANTVLKFNTALAGTELEAMRIDSSGNLGISTTNPTTKLEVNGTISATNIQTSGTVYATSFVGDGSGLTGIGGVQDRITSGTSSVFVAQDSAVSVTIGGSNIANFGSGGLGITAINASGLIQSTGISNTGAISTTGTGYFGGNVGIGTVAPNAPLTVQATGVIGGVTGYGLSLMSSDTNGPAIYFGGSGTYDGRLWALVATGSTNSSIGGAGKFVIADRTSSRARLAIDSSGNVGIGTVTPTATLQVSGTFIVSTTGQNTTPSLYVGSNGYVGVGTSSPGQLFTVSGPTVPARIASTNNNFVLQLKGNSDPTNGSYLGSTSGAMLFANTNGLENMRLDTSGNLGISTTTPTAKLEVNGTISATNIQTSGTVYAGHFVGDGSGLTGLAGGDRITSGTSSVFVAQDSAVSVTIGGSNIANFGSGGLGITAINASGLVQSTGISDSAAVSTTGTGYFGGTVNIGSSSSSAGWIFKVVGNSYNQGTFYNTSGVRSGNIYMGGYSGTGGSTVNTFNLPLALEVGTGFGVGIGTTAVPSATLQVSGSFIVSTTGQNTTPSLYVGSNGYVGVGTNNPSGNLDINAGSGAPMIYLKGTSFSQIVNSVNGNWYFSNTYSNDMIFRPVAGVETVRFASSGNVGISTSTPTAKLEVVGTVSATMVSTGALKVVTPTASATCAAGGDVGTMRLNASFVEVCSAYP